jgi:hypothetical protein
MAPKRKRSDSSFHKADKARIEKQVTKDELDNVYKDEEEDDVKGLSELKNISQLCERYKKMITTEYGLDKLTSLNGFLHYK